MRGESVVPLIALIDDTRRETPRRLRARSLSAARAGSSERGERSFVRSHRSAIVAMSRDRRSIEWEEGDDGGWETAVNEAEGREEL